MCIKAETARKVSKGSVEFIKKKEIYDLSTVNSLVNTKMAQGETKLIYTMYGGKLSEAEFTKYKGGVISSLKSCGYMLMNVKHPDKALFILDIDWDVEFALPTDA